jgi:thiamine biosynthesis lipoprotein
VSEDLYRFNGMTMGTTYSVKVISNTQNIDSDKIQTDIDYILDDVNQTMSTYIPDSELSLLNQNTESNWLEISDDLYSVIEHANQVSIVTHGAFDVTVGSLVNLWGFGPDPFTNDIPDESLLQTTMQHVGYEKIGIDLLSNRISKSDPDLYIDLSGIAKGYAVDRIAEYLEKKNINRYLIEIGGELKAKGLNAEQHPWQIGIEQAKSLERSIQRIVGLKDAAMATSGDYRNYFEKDGIRYSHTINPVSGKPIKHKLASVTVLHPSAMHADAMATAFMVLGTEKTHALANELNIAVYTLSKTDTGFEERYNDQFKPYLSNE